MGIISITMMIIANVGPMDVSKLNCIAVSNPFPKAGEVTETTKLEVTYFEDAGMRPFIHNKFKDHNIVVLFSEPNEFESHQVLSIGMNQSWFTIDKPSDSAFSALSPQDVRVTCSFGSVEDDQADDGSDDE